MLKGKFTLPRDVNTGNVAIPFAAAGNVSSTNCELGQLTVTNTTSATITLTLADRQASPINIEYQINADPNAPFILQWDPPLPCSGGATWQAQSTGLQGCVLGRRETGWVLDPGTSACTSTGS